MLQIGDITKRVAEKHAGSTAPLRDGEPFVRCSSGATIGWCGNQNTLGAWNLGTALPMLQPPPQPGFVLIYSNPLNSQTLTEPPGSKVNFVGEMNFCSATLDCVNGGGGGPGGTVTNIQVTPLAVFQG